MPSRQAATSCLISILKARERFAQAYPHDAVAIFVLPPSFAELEERLRRRGTENEAAIGERLRRARRGDFRLSRI